LVDTGSQNKFKGRNEEGKEKEKMNINTVFLRLSKFYGPTFSVPRVPLRHGLPPYRELKIE
jgi:hypothetical protein